MNLTRRPGIRPQEKVRNAFRIGHPVRVRKASAEPAPPDPRTSHGRVFFSADNWARGRAVIEAFPSAGMAIRGVHLLINATPPGKWQSPTLVGATDRIFPG
jgi:hypothetical protein